jgi:hypothetical protein
MKTLSVPSFAEYQLTDADVFVLTHLLTSKYYDASGITLYFMGSKITAIKWFRMRFGVGLLEAKNAVEKFDSEQSF